MYSVRQGGKGINQNSSEFKQRQQQLHWKLNQKSEFVLFQTTSLSFKELYLSSQKEKGNFSLCSRPL